MRRFIGTVDLSTLKVSFTPEVSHHIKVVRLQKGETIEVLSEGLSFTYKVEESYPLRLSFISQNKEMARELGFKSILLCPLLKKDNFEFCLQKAVELGVSDIYPYLSSRVIKRITKGEFEDKRERFEKILVEAVEQSNRDIVPTLHELTEYKDAIKTEGNLKFIAYEEEALKGQKINFESKEGLKVVSLFGPEGGFSKEEVDLALNEGFICISLGKRILRAETAMVNMLSVIDFIGE